MSVIFPNTASLLFRQEISPWYNGFNAPGSGSNGQLTFTNMDYNWYYLNSASYQTIGVIKGAAYTGSSNTFTEPQTFTSNVGISGSLTGSMANFSGQVISSYPGVGFFGTASWAINAINTVTSSLLSITSSVSASYASASDSASLIYVTSSRTSNVDYSLTFKNSTGALPNYYQLAVDDINGPYFNPSTNILHGTSLTLSASKGVFTSITGSLSGSATTAVSASYAVTASFSTISQTSSIIEGARYISGVGTSTLFKFIAGSDVIAGGIKIVTIPELAGRILGSSAFPVTTCSSSASPNGITFVDSLNTATGALTFTANHNHEFFYHIMYI